MDAKVESWSLYLTFTNSLESEMEHFFSDRDQENLGRCLRASRKVAKCGENAFIGKRIIRFKFWTPFLTIANPGTWSYIDHILTVKIDFWFLDFIRYHVDMYRL